jgi:hypothetical protein
MVGAHRMVVAALSVVLFGMAGCHCKKKSDEEILRERIDTTSVYMYVAAKIAIVKADSSPEAAEAKKLLLSVLEKTARKPAATPAAAQPKGEEAKLGAADLAKLAAELWKLRAVGKKVVQSGKEDELTPVLPILLEGTNLGALAPLIDLNDEHALFLIALFALKMHPKSPAPVPPEILLYEAWMTHADKLKIEGIASFVHAIKASAYATNDLCDLAATEGGHIDVGRETGALAKSLALFGAKADDKEAAELERAITLVAHGLTGACYLKRNEEHKAVPEVEKATKAAEELGVAPEETAKLRTAIKEKRDLRIVAIEIAWFELDKAGVLDDLAKTPVGGALKAYVTTAVAALTAAEATVGEAKDKGKKRLEDFFD